MVLCETFVTDTCGRSDSWRYYAFVLYVMIHVLLTHTHIHDTDVHDVQHSTQHLLQTVKLSQKTDPVNVYLWTKGKHSTNFPVP